MIEQRVIVRWPNGAEGAVLPADFADEAKADNFKGARILRWESGESYDGPTTPEGAARKEEREEEAQAEPERASPRRAREAKE